MLPSARIVHQVAGRRVRIKISSRKGEPDYFRSLSDSLAGFQSGLRVTVNPMTGSVLLDGDTIDLPELSKFAESNALFSLRPGRAANDPLVQKVVAPIQGVNDIIRKMTRGSLNLPEAVFILLLAFGLLEIARGNVRRPPWYTAFWYAFGLLTKTMVDQSADKR